MTMPIKVLQVVTLMNRGGEETMIMNYYRHMNRNEIQFDFLVHRDQIGAYEEEICALGGTVYRAFPIRPWNYSGYQKWLRVFFNEHKGEYAAVHAHILENCGFVLEEARRVGIPVRIAHSHLAQARIDMKFLFRKYGKYVLKKSDPTHRLACGEAAGKYLYDDAPFEVLPNAVDAQKYMYNPSARKSIRREFGVEDAVILGNVARFHPVKNQTFLVDIFVEYQKINPNAVLMMVGVGEELENVRKKVNKLGIQDKVIFTGLRTDVHCILQAFDILVFPSKLEGLPLSLIEAQAAGLPCLLSDHVTAETAITDLVQFERLNSPAVIWAKKIAEMLDTAVSRDAVTKIKEAGYDIQTNASRLFQMYSNRE